MVSVVVSVDDFDVRLDAVAVDGVFERSVPVGGSDFKRSTAGKVEQGLDDAFAEGGFADDGGFLVIFERASDDF